MLERISNLDDFKGLKNSLKMGYIMEKVRINRLQLELKNTFLMTKVTIIKLEMVEFSCILCLLMDN